MALASALEKIASGASRIDNMDAENNLATAHMFIMNPLHARSVDNLFSTHPNTQNRIKVLQEMAHEMRGKSIHNTTRRQRGPWG